MSIFYVSSFGGSATLWLSRVLSMHPSIVCWHGTRSIPPVPSTIDNTMPVADFAKSLRTCAEACHQLKVFGAVHGYPADAMKIAIETEGGRFSAIIRHPVARIHSLFWIYAIRFIDEEGLSARFPDPLAFFRWLETLGYPDMAAVERHLRDDPAATQTARRVDRMLRHVFDGSITCDVRIARRCQASQIVRMEDLTSDRECLRRFIEENVAPEISCDAGYLDSAFSVGATNRHAASPLCPADRFARWPKSLRDRYAEALACHDEPDLEKAYGTQGYEYRY